MIKAMLYERTVAGSSSCGQARFACFLLGFLYVLGLGYRVFLFSCLWCDCQCTSAVDWKITSAKIIKIDRDFPKL